MEQKTEADNVGVGSVQAYIKADADKTTAIMDMGRDFCTLLQVLDPTAQRWSERTLKTVGMYVFTDENGNETAEVIPTAFRNHCMFVYRNRDIAYEALAGGKRNIVPSTWVRRISEYLKPVVEVVVNRRPATELELSEGCKAHLVSAGKSLGGLDPTVLLEDEAVMLGKLVYSGAKKEMADSTEEAIREMYRNVA